MLGGAAGLTCHMPWHGSLDALYAMAR
jgi:hypothetical protein